MHSPWERYSTQIIKALNSLKGDCMTGPGHESHLQVSCNWDN